VRAGVGKLRENAFSSRRVRCVIMKSPHYSGPKTATTIYLVRNNIFTGSMCASIYLYIDGLVHVWCMT